MRSWKKPTDELVEKALQSVKTDADRRYFFSRLKNPHWIKPLQKREFFKHPPNVRQLPDGYVQYPAWIELQFLKNVVSEVPEQVIDILAKVPETDNPRFYDDVIDIALSVDASLSVRLKAIILECARGEHPTIIFRFNELLHHWTCEGQTEAALELTAVLVEFQKDPQSREKQRIRRANPESWASTLNPKPRFGEWEYEQLFEKGVRSLAEQAPYQTAQILIQAVDNMIYMQFHPDQLEKVSSSDYSTVWCKRVNDSSNEYKDSRETLTHALTFSCEQVYKKESDCVSDLNQMLRKPRWEIFVRIRQHLYASNLNEKTMPWIRDQVLTHEDYHKWEHHFEFQRMLRLACIHFGSDLLTVNEKEKIFKAILGGPSEESFREFTGEDFTEKLFEERRRYFHKMQLSPFAPILFGEYADYFQKLLEEEEQPIEDDDYAPSLSEGVKHIELRSPKPVEELKEMSDEELLLFLNEWDDVHSDRDKWWVEITFEALAQAFQLIFKEMILPVEQRLRFWTESRAQIKRPIYVRAMVVAMREHIESGQFNELAQCFAFCEWILSHPDLPKEESISRSDESKEYPDWQSSRRAVGDFAETCVKKDTNVPISMRDRIASLLDKLCTQYDRHLDEDERILLNEDNPLVEAINNTRSQALESVVNFGNWVRRQLEDNEAIVPEVFDILGKRFVVEAEYPLTLPEHVILGVHYGGIYGLDRDWAIEHKNYLFPKEDLRKWKETFGSFLERHHPGKQIFDLFQDDIECALEQIDTFNTSGYRRTDFIEALGRHLFTYYLWEVYPLTGDGSLLQRFYDRTKENKKQWAHLFNHVGRSISNSGEQLTNQLRHQVINFFEWRLKNREPSELKEFTYWLEAECLDAKWRLESYSQILDICSQEYGSAYQEITTLLEMRGEHVALVMECFGKLVDLSAHNDLIYIRTDKARMILQAGFASNDDEVQEKAENIREKLLQRGYFDLMD